VLYGHKRWAVFPPDTPKDVVKGGQGYNAGGISWFKNVYPKTQLPDWPTHKPIEFIQGPGETVFIPGGWHHVVVNLDTTVAVTQNFCSRTNFRLVWPRLARNRPKLSKKFLGEIQRTDAELTKLTETIDINARDELPSSSSSDSSSSSSESSDEEDAKPPKAAVQAKVKKQDESKDSRHEASETPKKKRRKTAGMGRSNPGKGGDDSDSDA